MPQLLLHDDHGRQVLDIDDSNPGHRYAITLPGNPWQDPKQPTLRFQTRSVADAGVDGFTSETVLTVLVHRLTMLNTTRPCRENLDALHAMRFALQSLNKRDIRMAKEAREAALDAKIEAAAVIPQPPPPAPTKKKAKRSATKGAQS